MPSLSCLGLSLSQSSVIDQLEHAIESPPVVARVIDLPRGAPKRKAPRRDEVPVTHLHRVQPEVAGGLIHQPLNEECGLRSPRPPVDAYWRGGRQYPRALDVARRDHIRPGQQTRLVPKGD